MRRGRTSHRIRPLKTILPTASTPGLAMLSSRGDDARWLGYRVDHERMNTHAGEPTVPGAPPGRDGSLPFTTASAVADGRDASDRRLATRAISVSAVGLALAGLAECW